MACSNHHPNLLSKQQSNPRKKMEKETAKENECKSSRAPYEGSVVHDGTGVWGVSQLLIRWTERCVRIRSRSIYKSTNQKKTLLPLCTRQVMERRSALIHVWMCECSTEICRSFITCWMLHLVKKLESRLKSLKKTKQPDWVYSKESKHIF